jgi:multimeric flavodoxin WrbA
MMRIALVNGSPKASKSASEVVLRSLKLMLPESDEMIEISMRNTSVSEEDLEKLAGCDTLVFAFPLYYDGIPSQLLRCLVQMESYFREKGVTGIRVYALVNNGFYEGRQNVYAIENMKHWALKSGLVWGQGIGLGGGGMLAPMKDITEGQGVKKNLGGALRTIAGNIASGNSAEPLFVSPEIPRIVYQLGGNMGWNAQSKANGLTKKDLGRRVMTLTR